MNLKRLLFWAVLFFALLTYVAVMDTPPPQELGSPPRGEEKIFAAAREDILSIEILSADGHAVVLRDGDSWRLTAPAGKSAPREICESLAAALLDAVVVEDISDNPDDLVAYGLEDPQLSVRLFLKNTTRPRVLHIGRNAPTAVSMYAMVGGERSVFLVGTFLRFSIKTFLDTIYR